MSHPLRTMLFDEHQRLGARMIEFAGWEMPLCYRDIRTEHRAVREAAGLFDLSHMGRIEVGGSGAPEFLDRLSTNRLIDLEPGRARYTVFCDDAGGALDDLVVFHDEDRHRVVPNAVNRETVLAWMREHAGAQKVDLRDRTFETGMLALQGPRAADILRRVGVPALDGLRYFHLRRDRLLGAPIVLSRTGYTGEDGFEILAPSDQMPRLWRSLLEAGAPAGLVPAGLGARDTLRLEAALCLYGHELTRKINPIEAGLERFVKFKDRDFIGKKKLLEASRSGNPQALRLIGLTLDSQRIPRAGYDILSAGKTVGNVSSGTFSPTLEKSIAMGYVPIMLSTAGTRLDVRVSQEVIPAVVTDLPFYVRRK